MEYKVKDISLAEEGKKKIEWAETRMPVMKYLTELYETESPLKGIKIAGCLHVTKETAILLKALKSAGADMRWAGCNPLSTQDDVAASLIKYYQIPVFAWRGLTTDEYYWCLDKVLEIKPNITVDDGADLVVRIHEKYQELIPNILGGTEETTTGVMRLKAMKKYGKLKYPIIAVNDAETKWDFDNIYGTGQSTIDGILRATNVMLAGKNFVVAGSGHCGKGVASRAKGMGANVIVTEVDPIKALKARMDGYEVMKMDDAAKIGDIFVTVTGCKDVITKRHMKKMKDGTILANAGHFNVEISVSDLEKLTREKREVRPNNIEYTLYDGRRLYLLGEGRLVNLVAAEGHPSEVMDMSFANQFLSIIYLSKHGKKMRPTVYNVGKKQDEEIAKIKLKTMGIEIDELTTKQKKYLKEYGSGT